MLLLCVVVPVPTQAADVSACFTPAERCLDRIVSAIDGARRQIRMQAYEFTSHPILQALVAASRRGVDVRIIVDRVAAEDAGGRAREARTAGLLVYVDTPRGIAHTKAIIIDDRLVIGGSYNYTQAAEAANVEDVTFITAPDVAAAFVRNWNSRLAESQPLRDGDDRARRYRHRHRASD